MFLANKDQKEKGLVGFKSPEGSSIGEKGRKNTDNNTYNK